MGSVFEKITLINATDVGDVRRGFMKAEEVRAVSVEALVDTGAATIVISEKLRCELGLDVIDTVEVDVPGGKKETCGITDGVIIRWQKRSALFNAWVLPEQKNVLLGALPLESMDLVVHPREGRLVGAHGDEPLGMIMQARSAP
ncbi:MAG: aspartyl protease family protein [Spirochaetaceae bacterium]|jgi:predicted aspartyl protease|nr:aspartyl protease family protein [Spirochaetaceae bacterium]